MPGGAGDAVVVVSVTDVDLTPASASAMNSRICADATDASTGTNTGSVTGTTRNTGTTRARLATMENGLPVSRTSRCFYWYFWLPEQGSNLRPSD